MAGKRYSQDDEEFKHLLRILNDLFRSGQISGGFLNTLPILRFVAPDMSGYTQQMVTFTAVHEFIRKSIREHEATFNEGNIRDFIDAYLQEIKEHISDGDSSFNGMHI
ncbi:hypothetical protein J437_LFUL018002 [Ladona fulva]|uniref:Uncharacterized protein n=1 Tax=Ladona fulva TaxID=123851 RepID=A0A8K0KTG1_LADFU|nr:hypothetical protein J437_LFUL018002 [Ladona fulva]